LQTMARLFLLIADKREIGTELVTKLVKTDSQ
jgi:hypothetical protein